MPLPSTAGLPLQLHRDRRCPGRAGPLARRRPQSSSCSHKDDRGRSVPLRHARAYPFPSYTIGKKKAGEGRKCRTTVRNLALSPFQGAHDRPPVVVSCRCYLYYGVVCVCCVLMTGPALPSSGGRQHPPGKGGSRSMATSYHHCFVWWFGGRGERGISFFLFPCEGPQVLG